MNNLLDPLIGPGDKGFPQTHPPMRRSEIGSQGWNVLRGDLAFPLAALRDTALTGNIEWLQRFVSERGLVLAPHGKTTMSPQLFRRQLDAGAWGMTIANVAQLTIAVASGARRCIIANQVMDAGDLRRLDGLRQETPGLEVAFLLDSIEQLRIIESCAGSGPHAVLIEMGVLGGRTGCRSVDAALALARAAHASRSVRLCGIECYEGLGVTGDDAHDTAWVDELLRDVHAIARRCDAEGWFESDEIIVSAGGSAVFDLVAERLLPELSRPVRGVLRSGCYVSHDDGMYARLGSSVARRLGCGIGLEAALEVWTTVQSCPEPGLAILGAGKRDVSCDVDLPRPRRWCRRGETALTDAPAGWAITRLNDQHAYLRVPSLDPSPRVGDRVALGISHPCTTFDKWRWMALVDERLDVIGAITTRF